MYGVVPKGFIPDIDNDTLNVNLRAAQGTSFYEMVNYVERVAQLDQREPEHRRDDGQHGRRQRRRHEHGPDQHPADAARRPDAVARRRSRSSCAAPLARFPGFQAFVNVPAALQIGGFQGNSNYNLMVQSLNNDELYKWAPVLEQAVGRSARSAGSLQQPRAQEPARGSRHRSRQDRGRRSGRDADRERPQRRARAPSGRRRSTARARSTRCCSSSIRSIRSRPTRCSGSASRRRAERSSRSNRSSASRRPSVPTASITWGSCRRCRFRSACGPACRSARPSITSTRSRRQVLPPDVTTTFQGSAKVFQQSLTNLGLLLFIAIGVVYIVLGHAVRELHPPADDSVRPAVGRPRARSSRSGCSGTS